jgi:hypothetical protein
MLLKLAPGVFELQDRISPSAAPTVAKHSENPRPANARSKADLERSGLASRNPPATKPRPKQG